MAANTETVSIDTVEKSLWNSIETLGKNISGETLDALLEMIESGGGSGTTYVHFTIVAEEGTPPSATTTAVFADVKTDFLSGKTLIAKVDIGGGVIVRAPLLSAVNENDPTGFIFAIVFNASGSTQTIQLQYASIAFAANGVEFAAANLAVET